MPEPSTNGKRCPWRFNNFHPPAGGGQFGSGCLNLSPGWFQQGHERIIDDLHVSQDMHKRGVPSFITETGPMELLANAVTSVINPQLYLAGLQAANAVQTLQPTVLWASVWSGIALIVNRETPCHRDTGGSVSMYDLLVSAGTHQACHIDIHELGAEFLYLPGTMLALSGKALSHGVKTWGGGERICAAHFMKDGVHNRVGQARPGWPILDDYL
ncbi:hypothetical protein FIBSPDRAFT_759968 [Athelia psychrophila]|uniref:2OGFeDO JBP1/TET oxygenase domain-containing protein n=2 Tax=Athelia psychrophila TaxID=1759441 RepID=A0A165YDL2_9AGAM|nr:hypothetical protein FIBSPDRAFT_762911 [Fibularhizoctonia sp. CBS 109695]KZP09452.1 hypothetical protein FIBSPDRAFT_759968 [Fibularhizoctonia sp. CBS 109695]